MNAALGLVARFGAVVLLLATAAACGFILGRGTAHPAAAPVCALSQEAVVLGTRVVYIPDC